MAQKRQPKSAKGRPATRKHKVSPAILHKIKGLQAHLIECPKDSVAKAAFNMLCREHPEYGFKPVTLEQLPKQLLEHELVIPF
jgi:hypothetical protein